MREGKVTCHKAGRYWVPITVMETSTDAEKIWGRGQQKNPMVRERNVLFNDALNTFYLRLYGIGHMVKDHSDSERGRKEMFYLTTHSTHFIYGYMVLDIWK